MAKKAPKSQDIKAKHLVIVSLLLAALLFASYYYSIFQEKEEQMVEEQPEVIEEIPEPLPPVEEPEEIKQPTEVLVEIKNFQFIPREVNITIGMTVVWKNIDVFTGDARPHMVAAHFREFRSPKLLINDTFNHTFTKVGTYTYMDAIFPTKMRIGKIVVTAPKTGLESVTGNVVGFNKNTATSVLTILLIIMIVLGLYDGKKLYLITHHKNK